MNKWQQQVYDMLRAASRKNLPCTIPADVTHIPANMMLEVDRKQWISVTERLPDTRHTMLVCTRNRNGIPKVAMACYHDGFGWCGSGGRWGNVTHWMPLPEPPKGEEE